MRCSAPCGNGGGPRGQTGDSRGRDGGVTSPSLVGFDLRPLGRLSVLISHDYHIGSPIVMGSLRELPTAPSPNLAVRVLHDVKAVCAMRRSRSLFIRLARWRRPENQEIRSRLSRRETSRVGTMPDFPFAVQVPAYPPSARETAPEGFWPWRAGTDTRTGTCAPATSLAGGRMSGARGGADEGAGVW